VYETGSAPRVFLYRCSGSLTDHENLVRLAAGKRLETHGSVIPAPALADQSLNRPPPPFQYRSLGWRYL
jgi:hypothetical protein